MKTMKAAVSDRYGSADVIEVRQVPMPEPAEGEVRVRVHATAVTRTDDGNLRAHPFLVRLFNGLARPRITILGTDFAGVVDAVGAGATAFAPGDRVFGLSGAKYGAHAEYVCVPESRGLAALPAGVAFHEAAVCEGARYADNFLEAFHLGPAHKILIYGASGAIGTAAVQLAVARGAEVTAVVDTRRLDLARSLGAQRVIDYTAEDFTRIGENFDFVLDAVGKTSYFRCRRILKPTGVFAASDMGPWGSNIFLTFWSAIARTGRVIFPMSGRKGFVSYLADLMEKVQFRAVIDRSYPLEAIAEAYRYVQTGQKTGIVVIDLVAP